MATNDLNIVLNQVRKIVFYKRDEITTDVICCEISVSFGGQEEVLFFHEEMPHWQEMIEKVSNLPDFDMKWFEKVAHPPFQTQQTVAYQARD